MNAFEILVQKASELTFDDTNFYFSGHILQGSYEKSRGPIPITVKGNIRLLVDGELPKAHPSIPTLGYRIIGDLWDDYDVLLTSTRKVRQSGDLLMITPASISEIVKMPDWKDHPLSGIPCGWSPLRGSYCHSATGNPGPFQDSWGNGHIRSVAITRNGETQTDAPLWIKLIFKDQRAEYVSKNWHAGPITFRGPIFFKNWSKDGEDRVEVNVNVYDYTLAAPRSKAA